MHFTVKILKNEVVSRQLEATAKVSITINEDAVNRAARHSVEFDQDSDGKAITFEDARREILYITEKEMETAKKRLSLKSRNDSEIEVGKYDYISVNVSYGDFEYKGSEVTEVEEPVFKLVNR